jgi:hypothetical protein
MSILMSRLTTENLLRRFVDSAVYNGLGIHRNIKEFAPAAIPVVPDVNQTVAEFLELVEFPLRRFT